MNDSIEQTKDWLRQAMVVDVAGRQAILRGALAKAMGLDPDIYARPFPGSVTIINQQAPTLPPEASAAIPAASTSPPPPADPRQFKVIRYRTLADGTTQDLETVIVTADNLAEALALANAKASG